VRLYLVQHGDALAEDADPARPLSQTGERDVRRLADFLAASGLTVSRVVHSGKLRARQTAEILAAGLASGTAAQEFAGLSPKDPTGPFAGLVARWQEDVMVVGHLPFLGKLLSRLTLGAEDREVTAFQPGSAVCLERAGKDAGGAADEGSWRLAWMLRPELLPPGA
jgi:phosphohistidine phosphatase